MTFTSLQDKRLLGALLAVLALAIVYGRLAAPEQRTVQLTYQRGAVATSPVRMGNRSPIAEDPVRVLLGRTGERYPGLVRDLFRMENPAVRPQPVKPAPVAPVLPAPPAAPVRSPEEIAADAARLDLSKFRFLGYLTDRESSLFLAKDGELFIVKSGDTILKSYRVKSTGKDFVILQDAATGVEVRVELSGSADQPPGAGAPLRQLP